MVILGITIGMIIPIAIKSAEIVKRFTEFVFIKTASKGVMTPFVFSSVAEQPQCVKTHKELSVISHK